MFRSVALKFLFVALLGVFWLTTDAMAAKRYALLIGNQQYSGSIAPLSNPFNDVAILDEALRQAGFPADAIDIITDGKKHEIENHLQAFAERLRDAGSGTVGFLFYAGHGIAHQKINYIVPVDADLSNILERSISLNSLIATLQKIAPDAIHFVISDACRNSVDAVPSGGAATKSVSGAHPLIPLSRGFLPLLPPPSAKASALLIAYSTAEGKTATDEGRYAGPYASALADWLVKPDIEVVTMFRQVQIDVENKIGQRPWMSYDRLPEFFFLDKGALAPGKDAARQKKLEVAIGETGKQLHNVHLLWVDDEQKNNYFERQALRKSGIFIDYAVSTQGVLKKIRQHGTGYYDLVISDMGRYKDRNCETPEDLEVCRTAGFETLKELKSRQQSLPVLFYTSSKRREKQAMALGAYALTDSPRELITFILRAVEQRKR